MRLRALLVAGALIVGACAPAQPVVAPALAPSENHTQLANVEGPTHDRAYRALRAGLRETQKYAEVLEASKTDERQSRAELDYLRRQAFYRIGEKALIKTVQRYCSYYPNRCRKQLENQTAPLGFGLSLLDDFGSDATLHLYHWLGARDLPTRQAESVLIREMLAAPGYAKCEPPSPREVADMRHELADFVLVERSDDRWTARLPNATELEDLSYFMVAVQEAGDPVGSSPNVDLEDRACEFIDGSGRSGSTEHLLDELRAVEAEGTLHDVVAAQRRVLESVGYPRPLGSCKDGHFETSRHSYGGLMRNFARNLEVVGQVEEAANAYRHASLHSGYCGNGSDRRWREQLHGAIRTGERSGGCRAVVAERLLDVLGKAYGLWRLKEAGFDVARLYRGALVTRNRHIAATALHQAFDTLPPAAAAAARQRLATRGPEAWEKRVYGIEGLADEAKRKALKPLLTLLGGLGEWDRKRAIKAIGYVAWRPYAGPCRVGVDYGRGFGSSHYQRSISPIGGDCDERLDDQEAAELASDIAHFSDDPSEDVRSAVAYALGDLGSAEGRDVLLRLKAQDPASTGGPEPFYPVRDAAEQALETLDETLANVAD